jgi:hypothetical protein
MNIQYALVYILYNHAQIHILVMNMCSSGFREWTHTPLPQQLMQNHKMSSINIHLCWNLSLHSLNKIENGNNIISFFLNLNVKSFQLGAASIHENDIETGSQHPHKRWLNGAVLQMRPKTEAPCHSKYGMIFKDPSLLKGPECQALV